MQNITILGIGRLGLCNALSLERVGFNVLGIDIFPDYIEKINNKTLTSYEPHVNDYLKDCKNFRASLSIEEGLKHSNLIIICVQTPNGGGEKFYDHSILNNLLSKINKYKLENKHFVITCTVMPKYIDTIGNTLLSECINCTLSYSPEFIAQGNIIEGYENPDIVLIGEGSTDAGDLIESVYKKVCRNTPKICRMKPLDAEITKIAINGFITTKIAYANMIGDACDNCGADKNKVMQAVGTDSRIGSKYIRPDYSYGGPCFPRDTKALAQFIEQVGGSADIPIATHKLNELHIKNQAEELLKEGKEEYVFENICYKPESKIPLVEESAKLKIAKYIVGKGKKVIIRDEKQLIEETKKEYGNIFKYDLR